MTALYYLNSAFGDLSKAAKYQAGKGYSWDFAGMSRCFFVSALLDVLLTSTGCAEPSDAKTASAPATARPAAASTSAAPPGSSAATPALPRHPYNSLVDDVLARTMSGQ